jgi:branched-chain amino acid transport system ATP-binding protein
LREHGMTAAGAPLLSCRNLCKYFGALAAVKDLSFDVAKGEVLGIGGPNGAGKTTLFEMISGLNPATSGDILFEGRNISRFSPERVCHEGILRTFQLNAGFDSLTVAETVLAAAQFGGVNRLWPGVRLDRKSRDEAAGAIDLVGLTAFRDALTETLPILERKLLMIASALATSPKLLLLDEPAGGLTPKEIDRVIGVVEAITARGVTVVLIEHVMRFLVRLSSRVMIMHHGEKIYEGSPEGLASDATVVDVYLGAGASIRLKAQLDGKGA